MAASCIALNAALSSRVDGWRIDGMDRWMDEWMAWMDECPCAIDYKDGLRDRQGKSGKVMQTNGNVITFISVVAKYRSRSTSTLSRMKGRKL